MRIMVSLNLADIMTSTRPRNPQPLHETLDNESDPASLVREDLESDHSEPFERETGTISTQV